MTRDVAIETLREQLDEVMDDVRRGVTVRVVEEGQMVAEIAPSSGPREELVWRPAVGSLADFIPPPPIAANVDIVALLREDRDAR